MQGSAVHIRVYRSRQPRRRPGVVDPEAGPGIPARRLTTGRTQGWSLDVIFKYFKNYLVTTVSELGGTMFIEEL